ncbi:type I restriction endonuclease subunit R [Nocardioides sp. zg-DK7169]|uniref:type I restriction endonuclease subunit R n=1 Tax=Nocardioides sp. zg-DK7169 TaxID=2736600 RepID=UPI0015533DFD|nr:DEAD/DEAH box helicase family protein [Nocardioides sp. zg-DK7169]NPC98743.1 type I restriction endonuclease subunit R [Nocardioides sp. zg-DK7169]
MEVHKERPFEDAICEHLAANGWHYSATDAGYDVERALFPNDVYDWLAEAYPDEWARLAEVTPIGRDPRIHLLDSLVTRLDKHGKPDGGTVGVLRRDHRLTGRGKTLRFKMCQFAPASNLNSDLLPLYNRVRLRVMRQVHYSKHNKSLSIDLVLFVNGLPVATCEVKSDYTQSVADAIEQYKEDRTPGTGRFTEPLLTAGARALVHFAVSHDEVYMTTRLNGAATIFLPFNQGRDNGPGNPDNPHGHATSYLWERVLARENLLDILGRFVHSEKMPDAENMEKAKRPKAKLLFPRYHQWDAVKSIVTDIREHLADPATTGVGRRYLIQHSAGSGKTSSIAWTAHALATLHATGPDGRDRKVYSSVVVLTDRTVLDDQLQKAIKEIDQTGIAVTPINVEEARRHGYSSKSELLAYALNRNHPIVVTTIQTFPHALTLMENQAERRFAVIIDEAHQSQDGETGRTVDAALARSEGLTWDARLRVFLDADGVEVTREEFDDRIEAEMAKRALSDQVTYVAFTATPKASTMTLFGTTNPYTGEVRPFHLYTMKQALAEGFILDVLANYQSVDFKALIDEASRPGMTPFDERLVDPRLARRELNRRLYEDPDLIAAKARWIVEHFTHKVAPLLSGTAKAMVVTYSRVAAVRYLRAIEAEASRLGSELRGLVAFSGTVTESGREESESTLNGNAKEPADLFKGDDAYSVIVVANKYQTGFSEPRLSAMYLDKPVSGINAVQTLSRLNRTMPAEGKDKVFVVDFTSRGEQMLKAFRQFHTEAKLPHEVDVAQIYDLLAAINGEGLYDEATVKRAVEGALAGDQAAMDAAVAPVARDWQRRLAEAQSREDIEEASRLLNFAANVSNFLTAYSFMSQVHDFAEAALEKQHLFLGLLNKRFRRDPSPRPDLSGVAVRLLEVEEGAVASLVFGNEPEDLAPPEFGVSDGVREDPVEETLRHIIDEFNARLADAGVEVSTENSPAWLDALVGLVLNDEGLRGQARDNDPDDFEDSLDLQIAVAEAVRGFGDDAAALAQGFHSDGDVQRAVVQAVSQLAHVYATQRTGRHQPEPDRTAEA